METKIKTRYVLPDASANATKRFGKITLNIKRWKQKGSEMYPDDIRGQQLCYMEGCITNPCRRCGVTNYALLGYTGAVARWSKEWGISAEETERRFERTYDTSISD